MSVIHAEDLKNGLNSDQLEDITRKTVSQFDSLGRVLLIHPDYSRHDYSDTIVPILYRALSVRGLFTARLTG